MQQGDVKLFQNADGGEVTVEDGVAEMSGGLETSAFLSLFGGNEDDDGLRGSSATWWGNLDETQPARERVASSVLVSVSMPGVNKIKLVIDIEARGEESRFEFVENWRVTT